ncbi:hypothetical protein GobsT_63810 [Gemmata obscuriglobus]|nr:hypothetical protein GobsT_63810 [Gemmata obscuriglobus]VTS10901.1 unnamed protein product [Gemmata obscuriglobus UQM 2246]
MRPGSDGGVRCSAGFGFCAGRCGSAEPALVPRIRGATTAPARRAAAHRWPPTTATRGDEPRPPPAGTTRSTTDPHHRVAAHHGPCPTAPRGGEPRQTRSAPRGARRARYTHADHTHTTARAIKRPSGCRTNSSPAPPPPDEQCVPNQPAVSGAAPGSARGPPRFRVARRAPRLRGARATDAGGRSTTDPARRVPAHRWPPTTAPRGDEPRQPRSAPRGAPPTRTTVSRRTARHAQPHLAAMSRAGPERHHAEHHRPELPCPTIPPATPTASSRRRAAPDPIGTTRSPTREVHPRGPHRQRRRTRAPARDGCRT